MRCLHSERLSEAQPTPSPEPTSEAPNESLPDSSSAQSSEVKITKLKKKLILSTNTSKHIRRGISKEQDNKGKDSQRKEGAIESVSKQGWKNANGEDNKWKVILSKLMLLKESFEGTEDQREGIEEKVESTAEQKESTAEQKESTEEQTKEEIATQATQTSTQTPSSIIFGDDETIATLLINIATQ
ncbi:hypothetical protein Tco_0199150 [Tanacetum coccineum]